MDKEQLIGYISQAAKEGKQKQEIITELKLEGYTVPDIEDAYNTWENPSLPAASNAAGTFDGPAEAAPPNFPPPPPRSHPHYRLFLIGGIALLLLSGGLIFALRSRTAPTPPPAAPTATPAVPTPTTENTPTPTPTPPSVADCNLLDGGACIREHFLSCTPAAYTETLPATPPAQIVYRNEIIGKRGNTCLFKSTSLEYPDPEWIGKSMTCKLDNTKDFLTEIQNRQLCSGPLRDLMQQGE